MRGRSNKQEVVIYKHSPTHPGAWAPAVTLDKDRLKFLRRSYWVVFSSLRSGVTCIYLNYLLLNALLCCS